MKTTNLLAILATATFASQASAEGAPTMQMDEDLIAKEMAHSSATSAEYIPLLLMFLMVIMALQSKSGGCMYSCYGASGEDVIFDPEADMIQRT